MQGENKTVVPEEEIPAELAGLEGWVYDARQKLLRRTWQFERFVPTMAFVRALTEVMDDCNHHADFSLDSRRKTLTVEVTTHSADAVTRADLDFAAAVNRVG